MSHVSLNTEAGLVHIHILNVIMIIVYRKGDIVMEPMISRDVLPKNVPGWGGVGWGGVGWVM